jgi:hypothetical protein
VPLASQAIHAVALQQDAGPPITHPDAQFCSHASCCKLEEYHLTPGFLNCVASSIAATPRNKNKTTKNIPSKELFVAKQSGLKENKIYLLTNINKVEKSGFLPSNAA